MDLIVVELLVLMMAVVSQTPASMINVLSALLIQVVCVMDSNVHKTQTVLLVTV
jgi:hypothetical protein